MPLIESPPWPVIVLMFAGDLLLVVYLVMPREARPTIRGVARAAAAGGRWLLEHRRQALAVLRRRTR